MNEQDNSEEFFWKTYETLPDNIKEALFSEENFNIVSEICEKNGITSEETKSQLVKYVGKTLMGLLPIKEFSIILELELNLDSEVARNISWDIDSRIFSHLRISLNKLYSPNIAEKKELVDNTKKEGEIKTEIEGEIKPEEKKVTEPVNPEDKYKEPLI
ncbi:MAG: hypothetical protein WC938_00940 [Candidatus Paceibacterota bacterium]|jgi:hypothetical protein